MMGFADLSVPHAILVALVNVLLFPVYLWASSFIQPLADRHASRFLVAALCSGAGWAANALLTGQAGTDLAAGFCVVAGGVLFYLQVWGLLTRGYTLGILLTLLRVNRPMTADEVATGYRGGSGLQWIMHHRLGGLTGAGMLKRNGDTLVLGSMRGVAVARVYRACVSVLGLRRTG
jgi:hypothetical protein